MKLILLSIEPAMNDAPLRNGENTVLTAPETGLLPEKCVITAVKAATAAIIAAAVPSFFC